LDYLRVVPALQGTAYAKEIEGSLSMTLSLRLLNIYLQGEVGPSLTTCRKGIGEDGSVYIVGLEVVPDSVTELRCVGNVLRNKEITNGGIVGTKHPFDIFVGIS
jgi:hypothetical protein